MEENLILKNTTEKSQKIANDFLSYYESKQQYGRVIKEISEKFSGDFENLNTEIYYEIIEHFKKMLKVTHRGHMWRAFLNIYMLLIC